MKAIIKLFKMIFLGIYRLIDKFIVTPISRVIFSINGYLKTHNLKLDYIISRPNFIIYVSLILAVLMFVLIDSRVITLVESEAEVITDVPVKVNYNEEAYVVEGIPDTVDIVLIGRKSDIYLAKQLGTNMVILDLSQYEARDSAYKVYLSYTKSIDSINYKLDPSYVSVTIKDKISVTKAIDYDLVNEDALNDKLSVESVELSKTEVVVKGSKDTINRIASIKALIDLNNSSLSEAGTYEVDSISLLAYDSKGRIVEDAEIIPTTLTASITLDTYSKSVPIEVLTTGNLVTGKAIASILINNSNSHAITIFGEEEAINNIASVPVTINVAEQGTNTKTYNVNIGKPTGVRAISETKANITVTFGDEKQKEVAVSTVSQKNLASGLTANIVGTNSIKVIVKGVQSVLDTVTENTINAYIDLENYTAGEYDVQVKIDSNDPKVNYVVSSTVKVKITNNN
ncbi:MAG: CdaR family protein [Ruminococcus sp.]|nr:CdaR family protein [Ruminococcus sp.]